MANVNHTSIQNACNGRLSHHSLEAHQKLNTEALEGVLPYITLTDDELLLQVSKLSPDPLVLELAHRFEFLCLNP